MNLGPVPQWVDVCLVSVETENLPDLLHLRLGHERLRHVFNHSVRDIHPESGNTTVGPESQSSQEVFGHIGMVPVEIRLGRVEHVQVELSIAGRVPGGFAKLSNPVCGRLVLVGSNT